MDDTKRIVDETAAPMVEDRVRRAVDGLRRTGPLCVKKNGGHFVVYQYTLTNFVVINRKNPSFVVIF